MYSLIYCTPLKIVYIVEFSWLGYKINTKNLDVYLDMSPTYKQGKRKCCNIVKIAHSDRCPTTMPRYEGFDND